jgi:hypothetical protein
MEEVVKWGKGVQQGASGASTAERHGLEFKPSTGQFHRAAAVSHLIRMLRLALSRVTFHSTHPPIYPLHRLFSNCRVSLMESESTGTHRDPVTGEMISKQYVYFPPDVVPLLIDPSRAGNLSVAKSNVKKRQGGRRILRIGLQLRTKTTPQRRLQTRKIFRLMYVGRIDICAIFRR